MRTPDRRSGRASASSVVVILSSYTDKKSLAAAAILVCGALRGALERAYLRALVLSNRGQHASRNELAPNLPIPPNSRDGRSRRRIVGPLFGARGRCAGGADPL